jgi:hypothetical protein
MQPVPDFFTELQIRIFREVYNVDLFMNNLSYSRMNTLTIGEWYMYVMIQYALSLRARVVNIDVC